MAFQIKKISNHGTANPIVARLSLQTHELIQFCQIDKQTKDDVFALYHSEVQPKLLECDDIAQAISSEILQISMELEKKGFITQSGGRVLEVPFLIRLDQRLEQFLYNAKSTLRDLAKIFELFFGKKFNEARYDKILKWSVQEFGKDSELSKVIRQDHDLWIKRLVDMRNAVEHPGGFSGTLYIQNFSLIPGNTPDYPKLEEPTWHLNDDLIVSVAQDLLMFVTNILEFSEDILVICMHLKGLPKMLRVAEIAGENRSEECPIRLRVVLNTEI